MQHATTAVPRKEGLEDVHVVYTGDNSADQRAMFTPTFLWHSDVCLLGSIFGYYRNLIVPFRLLTKCNHHHTHL